MNGSPLTAGSGVAGVFGAALANGGSLDDVGPGIDFFAKLKTVGNWLPVDSSPQTVASGQTPIVIDWDYLNLAYAKEFPAANWKVDDPDRRRLRLLLLPGDQRDRSAPVGGPALAGVPVLRPGPDHLAEGLHAPGALPGPLDAEGDPEGAAARPAAGVDLCEDQVREQRPADEGEGADRHRLAGEDGELAHLVGSRTGGAPAGHRVRPEAPLARLDRDAPLLRVHDPLPVPAGGRGARRRVQGQPRRLDDVEPDAARARAVPPRVPDEHRDQRSSPPCSAARLGLALAYAGDPRRDAALDPLDADDVLGRRRELRRHPARVRVHRDARHDRGRDAVPAEPAAPRPLARLRDLFTKTGVEIVYLYFQIPLMVLVIAPAIDGLRREWREAASNLGASSWQFWRHVGLPVLMPSRARRADPALRQRVRGVRDRLLAHERQRLHRPGRDRRVLHRQRVLEPAPRAGARVRDVPRPRGDDARLHPAPAARGAGGRGEAPPPHRAVRGRAGSSSAPPTSSSR